MSEVLAIDAGGTKVLVGIVNERGEVLARVRDSVPTADYRAYFARCAEMSRECAAAAGRSLGDLAAVGMNIPGMATPDGHVFGSPSSGWPAFEARPLLAEFLGAGDLPVGFDNDINACAQAERLFAAAPDDFLWVTVSTGVGGAVFADGRLVRGVRNCAGEIGHVKVEFERPRPCGCGGCGCLEAHVSGKALARRAAEVYGAERALTAKDLEDLARQGDAQALEIYAEAGKCLGRALGAAANLTNFSRAYVGGGVSPALDLMLPALRTAFDACAVRPVAEGVEVVRTKLGYEAALLGAAATAFGSVRR